MKSDNIKNIPNPKMLEIEIEELRNKLKLAEKAIKISQRRYEIAVGLSDVTIFDYNIKTKKIMTQPIDFEIFGMPGVLEQGVDEVLSSGIIAERSKQDIADLYRKIDNGALKASTTIYANDLSGGERTLALQMVSIFDQDGDPTYAVGVRKDITESVKFRREKEYSELLASGLNFIYEANVTQDKLIRYESKWADEIGLGEINTLTGVLRLMRSKHIAPADAEMFVNMQCREAILEDFKNGKRIVEFQYRKNVAGKGYQWFEVRINLIEEELTKDIDMRVYISNIDSKKKKEIRAVVEHTQYELAVARSALIYELNITKNIMNYIREDLSDRFELFYGEHFAEEVLPHILELIHPHERKLIFNLMQKDNLLKAYEENKNDITCEYRRIDKSGKYNWFRSSLQFFKDPQTDDIFCYSYIEDINEEKEKEEILLYKAQHDLMTGFYNKNISAEKVNEFLNSEEGSSGRHVFFIIDIDDFKKVNDTFGHTFGDAVLSQTSAKIKTLFRTDDIFGRIGGDEFVVFMKNIRSEEAASVKARELCDGVAEIYKNEGTEYRVTVSVGLAIYNKHGKNYSELYRHSDAALYEAKEQGRNRFSVYREDMQQNKTAVKGIDERQILKTETFESSINEYIFRILYESKNKRQAINSVLELFGKQYHVSRVYVYENAENNKSANITFEWCGQGIVSQIGRTPKISYSELKNHKSNFNDEGVFIVSDLSKASPEIRKILDEHNVKSMIQFSVLEKGKFVGFIGFDECESVSILSDKEMNDYQNFANVLGIFITEMRSFERVEVAQNIALSVVNGLASYAYVCDPCTYKIMFANSRVLEFAPNTKTGDCCYEALFKRKEPCENCVMKALVESGEEKIAKMSSRSDIKEHVKIIASWVNWLDDKRGCLMDIVDVTEFIKDKKEMDF